MQQTEVSHLCAVFERQTDRVLMIDSVTGETLTYGMFLEDTLSLAAHLQRQGVQVGDRIAFCAKNSIDLAKLFFAGWHCGAQVVPVNPQLHGHDIAHILVDCAPRLVFVGSAVAVRDDVDLHAICPGDSLRCFAAASEPVSQRHRTEISFSVAEAVAAGRGLPAPAPFGGAPDDIAFLRIYTSGSTSRPKGIAVTYGGLVANERAFGARMGIGPGNRFFNILPMCYLGGVHNLLLLPIANEASIVMGEPLAGSALFAFWEMVRDYEVNTLWFTSAMLNMLMSLRDDEDLSFLHSQIRLGLVGMAPLSPAIKANFEDRFGFVLHENYALSETAFLTSGPTHLPYRPGSCGTPLPGVEIDIVGADGTVLPDGEIGEIRARTPYLMQGYINVAEAEAAAVTPQGFLTGDLGYLDGGELFPTGRAKDLIIRGGLNISPAAVEEALYKHPAVELAAVVGVPHEIYGEEVAALVTLKATARGTVTGRDILAVCKTHIAHFQCPKSVEVVDTMPLGATGKVDKRAIRNSLTPQPTT